MNPSAARLGAQVRSSSPVSGGDHTEPSSPFAALLRLAFTPSAAEPVCWQTDVIDRFAERYALWGR